MNLLYPQLHSGLLRLLAYLACLAASIPLTLSAELFIPATDININYVGRFDDSDPTAPVAYWSGTQIKAKFEGTTIKAVLNDSDDSYYNVIIDNGPPVKLDLLPGSNIYTLATGLADTTHTIELFKRTSWQSGSVSFEGFYIDDGKALLPLSSPTIKIEFYGDSISDGHSVDSLTNTEAPNLWNNYLAFPAITARALGAEYVCNASSGIAVHTGWSAGQPHNLMGDAYDNINPADNASVWDFAKYTPDVVVVNLFQNDAWKNPTPHDAAMQTDIKNTYKDLIDNIRLQYADAHIFCVLGNMDASAMNHAWSGYIEDVVAQLNSAGDNRVYSDIFAFKNIGGGHPHQAEHRAMAAQLTEFIRTTLPSMFPTGTPTTILEEDFEGSNPTYALQTNGGSWADTGVQYQQQTSGTTGIATVGDTGWADYTVESDIRTTSTVTSDNACGLIFRYVDSLNYYWVDIIKNPNDGYVRINKREAGVDTTLFTFDNHWWSGRFKASDNNRFRVSVVGNEITVFINEKCVFVEYDSTFSAGAVGYRSKNVTGVFDNLTVTQMIASEPTFTAQAATLVSSSEAELNYTLIDGGEASTVTLYWGSSDGGTNPGSWDNSINAGTKASGNYAESLSGLTPSTPYYFTGYATNAEGNSWGTTQTFTLAAPVAPTLTTQEAALVSASEADLNYILADGGEVSTVTLYWGSSDGGTNPGAWDNSINLGAKASGTYLESLTGLTPGNTYYFIGYASNAAGNSWGSSQTFTLLNQTTLYSDSFDNHGTPENSNQINLNGLNPEINNDLASATWTGNTSSNSTPNSWSSYALVKNRLGTTTLDFGSQSAGNAGQGGSAWLPITNPVQYGTLSIKADLTGLNNATRVFIGFSAPLATNDNAASQSVWSQAPADGLYLAFELNDAGVITQAGVYYGGSENQVFDLITTAGLGASAGNYVGHRWELLVDIEDDTYAILRDDVLVTGGEGLVYPGGLIEANTLDSVVLSGEFYTSTSTWRGIRFNAFEVISTPPAPANFTTWMAAHGVSDTTPEGDDDHDGISNLQEYAYSTAGIAVDPSNNDATFLSPTVAINESNHLALKLVRADTLPANVSLMIEASEDLSTWLDITGTVTITSDGPNGYLSGASNYSYTIPHDIGGYHSRFMRVRFEEN